MDALDVEMSIAEGAQALQALLKFVTEGAHQREAPEAEQGLFTRRLPRGLAAMQRYFAQRGTGEVGAALTRADGEMRPREKPRRGRDYVSLFGQFKVARTCYRTPGEPGICPLDAPVNRPARCDADFVPEWMTVFAVEHPCQASAGCCAPRFELEVAERVVMEVAPEAPQDAEDFYAPRPLAPEDPAGELLGVRFDGTGVPRLQAEAAKLKAKVGTGAKRQTKKAARVGGSYTVDPKPRGPAARAALLVAPEAARARRPRDHVTDEAPRAQQGRGVARLGRTKPQVRERIKADAERRDPQHRTPVVIRLAGALGLGRLAPQRFKPWTRVTCGLDILHVVGYLWSAANARFGEQSNAGQRWVHQKLTAMRRGRVGYVLGGLRQILTKPRLRKSVRETRAKVITFFHNHRRWMPYDAYLAAGVPVGTGVVESACGSVVKHRMEGEGQRWSLAGAEALVTLRSRKKRHDHDLRAYWRFHARQVRVRLDGRQPKYRPVPRLRRAASPNSKRSRSIGLY
jgi:hypothetical protein